jgi:hypothetical protein
MLLSTDLCGEATENRSTMVFAETESPACAKTQPEKNTDTSINCLRILIKTLALQI